MVFYSVFLFALTLAQGPGKGISKDTRACSEGVIDTTLAFMLKYFPVSEAQDDCSNHVCTCGRQARVQLDSDDSIVHNVTVDERRTQRRRSPGGISGFGLHCVYAAGKNKVRQKQSGNKTQEELEAIFCDKFGSMTEYDVFMEYNTGLFTSDISSFVTALKNGGESFLTLRWSDSTGSYVSVLVHPPNTQIIHEVVGDSASMSEEMLADAKELKSPRFYFDTKPTASAGQMTALWVSRATTDAARDKTYFEAVFPASTTSLTTISGADGKSQKMLTVQVASTATTKIRLIEPADSNSGDYSVSWWETYLNDVHKEYMTSPTCGWDLLADNHNAYDWLSFSSENPDQGDIVKAVAGQGLGYFCKSAGFGQTHCYINTPYGYQFQLDGTYNNPPTYYSYDSTHQLCATYQEYC